MMIMTLKILGIMAVSISATFAQGNSTVLCIPGLCLQGYSNTPLGAQLSAPGAQTTLHLLPGQYDSDTNPQLLHDTLTAEGASVVSSTGFGNDTSVTIPLNLELRPGLAVFSERLYAGQSGFTPLPTTPISGNSSTTFANASSIVLAPNIWFAATTSTNSNPNSNSNSTTRTIFWDSIPDINQLPQGPSTSLTLLDIQSSACSPPCSGAGICSPPSSSSSTSTGSSGTCVCPPGFTGSECESCLPGFFGPTCSPCPQDGGCPEGECDEGIGGSGRCKIQVVKNLPLTTCNCLNGVCSSGTGGGGGGVGGGGGGNGGGECDCNEGWTKADNGTECAKCMEGFYLTSTGDCKVCQLGCTSCQDTTGICGSCKQGFTQNAQDRTKCDPPVQATSAGQICPDGSFGGGGQTQCQTCDGACETCTGGGGGDCVVCKKGTFSLAGNGGGGCVGTDGEGVCNGTRMVGDNNKRECEACDAKCTTCIIPNFTAASTIDQVQCTGCIPGSFLSNGKCIGSCPQGTFVSTKDNFTCLPCDQSCQQCAGTATFCTTCPSNLFVSPEGRCISTCPSNTFPSSGSCIPCHPDCTTCSGGSFNQCLTCPAERPVLNGGRCLPTCSKDQYFDPVASTCQSCDGSCSSCSGPGPNNCLGCVSGREALRVGRCLAANCQPQGSDSTSTNEVLPGLGVCLSDLIVVPQPSGTGEASPLPSISGLSTPTEKKGKGGKGGLEWWQILLIALGCAIGLVGVGFWWRRRRGRKERMKGSSRFNLNHPPEGQGEKGGGWKWKLIRFGERFFGGGKRSRKVPEIHRVESYRDHHGYGDEEMGVGKVQEAKLDEGGKMKIRRVDTHEQDMVKLIEGYKTPPSLSRSRAPSPDRSGVVHPTSTYHQDFLHDYDHEDDNRSRTTQRRSFDETSRLSAPSIYSQMTGIPRRGVEPREPVRRGLGSRFSGSTEGGGMRSEGRFLMPVDQRRPGAGWI